MKSEIHPAYAPIVFRDLFNTLRMLAEHRDHTRRQAMGKGILVFDDSMFALALTLPRD